MAETVPTPAPRPENPRRVPRVSDPRAAHHPRPEAPPAATHPEAPTEQTPEVREKREILKWLTNAASELLYPLPIVGSYMRPDHEYVMELVRTVVHRAVKMVIQEPGKVDHKGEHRGSHIRRPGALPIAALVATLLAGVGYHQSNKPGFVKDAKDGVKNALAHKLEELAQELISDQ